MTRTQQLPNFAVVFAVLFALQAVTVTIIAPDLITHTANASVIGR